MKKLRWLNWKDDKWLSPHGAILHYDKMEHLLASAALAYVGTFFIPLLMACIVALLIGFLWEYKDGLMPYEKYGWFGGEGFSWKDLIADFVGIVIVFSLKF